MLPHPQKVPCTLHRQHLLFQMPSPVHLRGIFPDNIEGLLGEYFEALRNCRVLTGGLLACKADGFLSPPTSGSLCLHLSLYGLPLRLKFRSSIEAEIAPRSCYFLGGWGSPESGSFQCSGAPGGAVGETGRCFQGGPPPIPGSQEDSLASIYNPKVRGALSSSHVQVPLIWTH